MNSKLFARIGAIGFVAVAITMTALQLREERKPEPPEVVTVVEPDGDPLPEMLRLCSELGQVAETTNECSQAWAENRRRFLAPGARPMERFPRPNPVIDNSGLPSGSPRVTAPSSSGGQ
ncbi:MAG: putative entry exclusion protein TrbK-alt [Novosphingobium sp.]|uniref:putative entry exclusion protein TrbK-alt n=1 Tax=Novosphingobium sp. TaxID=1874826 RepID=UPI001DE45687|nr:putative entry exclusion protein TrbK-alt [Novosphingobium sp.]MCB2057138.1 putative entry exclusion protein TrbK-alt [Novosphingobium sp.]MCP5386005.1 putative entry exclusion protein TrbK-alt [Novosphingobium sp.]